MSFLCDPWKWWINGLANSLGLGFLKNRNYMPDTQITPCLCFQGTIIQHFSASRCTVMTGMKKPSMVRSGRQTIPQDRWDQNFSRQLPG